MLVDNEAVLEAADAEEVIDIGDDMESDDEGHEGKDEVDDGAKDMENRSLLYFIHY